MGKMVLCFLMLTIFNWNTKSCRRESQKSYDDSEKKDIVWEITDVSKSVTLFYRIKGENKAIRRFASGKANGTFSLAFGTGTSEGVFEGILDCDYLTNAKFIHLDSIEVNEQEFNIPDGEFRYMVFLPGTATQGKIKIGFSEEPK